MNTQSSCDKVTTTWQQGSDVGRVVSSWKHDGRMELLLEIDENRLQGAFVRQFVENGMCKVHVPARVTQAYYAASFTH
jgi:hypothetical protein